MFNKKSKCINSTCNNRESLINIKKNSLFIAVSLSMSFITSAINIIIKLNHLIIIFTLFLFILSFIRNNFYIKKDHIIFVIITGFQILISLVIGDIKDEIQINYTLNYIANAVLLVYLVSFKYDFKEICKFISMIFTFSIWALLFIDVMNYDSGSLMGLGYSIVPFFLASIYYLSYYGKDKKTNKIIVLCSLIVYTTWSYKFVSRGVILAVITYIYLLYILNTKRSIKNNIIILISIIILLFFILNFNEIVIILNNFLLNNNIRIKFLTKIVLLLNEGNLDNGRFIIYNISWNNFKESPILGNGIASLHRLSGVNYDHSLMLQLLNEGGIIFFFIHILIIIKGIFIIFRDWRRSINISHFLLFLVCNSLIRLSLSSVFWLEQGYWMYLYISFSNKSNKRFGYNGKDKSKLGRRLPC